MNFLVFAYSDIHIYSTLGILISHYRATNCTSHVHIYATPSLYKRYSQIFARKSFLSIFASFNLSLSLHLFRSPGTNSSKRLKAQALLNSFAFPKPNLGFSKCFIPNFSNPYICLLLTKIRFDSLVYIDEGNTNLSLNRYFSHNERSNSFYIVNKITPYLSSFQFGVHDLISSRYSFNPVQTNEILSKNGVDKYHFDDICPYLLLYFSHFGSLNDLPQGSKYHLVVTSPLTANGYTDYTDQEIDILDSQLSYLEKLDPLAIIIIKLHYRDSPERYAFLQDKYKCHVYDGLFSAQDLILSGQIASISCFHSSAVFSILDIISDIPIFCLCQSIKSSKMLQITHSLKKHYFQRVIFRP